MTSERIFIIRQASGRQQSASSRKNPMSCRRGYFHRFVFYNFRCAFFVWDSQILFWSDRQYCRLNSLENPDNTYNSEDSLRCTFCIRAMDSIYHAYRCPMRMFRHRTDNIPQYHLLLGDTGTSIITGKTSYCEYRCRLGCDDSYLKKSDSSISRSEKRP